MITTLQEYKLYCYATDRTQAEIYIRSHSGRVLDCKQDGDWITVTYLAEKEL